METLPRQLPPSASTSASASPPSPTSTSYSPFLLSFHSHQLRNDYQIFKHQQQQKRNHSLCSGVFLFLLTCYYIHEVISRLISSNSHHHSPSSNILTIYIPIILLFFCFLSLLIGWLIHSQSIFHFIHRRLLKIFRTTNYSSYWLQNLFLLSLCYNSFIVLIFRTIISHHYLKETLHTNDDDKFNGSSLLPSDYIFTIYLLPLIIPSFFKSCSFGIILITWCGSFLSLTFCLISLHMTTFQSIKDERLFFICYLLLLLSLVFLYNHEYSLLSQFIDSMEGENTSSHRHENHQKVMLSLEKQHIEKVIGSIAHDLRTPMQSLQLDLNSLIEMILSPQSGFLPTIPSTTIGNSLSTTLTTVVASTPISTVSYTQHNIQEMVSIIEDLHDTLYFMFASVNRGVDYCKINNGTTLLYTREIVDYYLCVTNAIALVSRSVANGIKITQRIVHYDTSHKFIQTDKSWLFENLICLISNAVKYSSGGDVSVVVECCKTATSQSSHLLFLVENNSSGPIHTELNGEDGVGTSPGPGSGGDDAGADPMAIFHNFSISHRTSGGAGLGLFILATRIKILGGEYGCESKKQPQPSNPAPYVTRFWFTLPLHSFPTNTPNKKKETDLPSEQNSQRKTENQRLQNFFISSHLNYSRDEEEDDSNSLFSIRTLDFSRIESLTPYGGGSETSGRKYSVRSGPVTVFEEVEELRCEEINSYKEMKESNTTLVPCMTSFSNDLQLLDHEEEVKLLVQTGPPPLVEPRRHQQDLTEEGEGEGVGEEEKDQDRARDRGGKKEKEREREKPAVIESRRKSESKGYKSKFWKMTRKVHSASDLHQIETQQPSPPSPSPSSHSSSISHSVNPSSCENSLQPPQQKHSQQPQQENLNLSSESSQHISNPTNIEIHTDFNSLQEQKLEEKVVPKLNLNSNSNPLPGKPPPSNHSFEEETESTPAPRRILVVDDSTVIQKATKRSLLRAGYEVELADNGLNAFNLMKEHLFSAVLMDIEMPIMGGLEATQKIREFERQESREPTQQQKIIGVTASTDSSIREKALEVGMNEFMYKPFQLESIQMIFTRLSI